MSSRFGAGGDGRVLTCVLVSAAVFFVYRLIGAGPARPCPAPPAAAATGGADDTATAIATLASASAAHGGLALSLSESEKVRCYNWLETDMQDCEYVVRWLAQNSAAEDRRTAYTPTALELAERKVVAQKSLFCSVAPGAQAALFGRHQPFAELLSGGGGGGGGGGGAAATAEVAVTATAKQTPSAGGASAAVEADKSCTACPTAAECASRCPRPPVPAPTPAPSIAPTAHPAAAAPNRPLGPAKVPPSKEKRVIAYGLYGSAPRYVTGAFRNAELAPSVMPGWVVRFYHDSSVPRQALDRLAALGAELRPMSHGHGTGGIAGMFWRFLVADDPTVDRYIIRDSDSRLTAREALAVQAWIDSGKKYHILRDHPAHSHFPVSGGLWGGVHDPTLRMEQKMQTHPNKHDYVEDMHFLRDQVYPVMLRSLLAHDAYSCSACADPQHADACQWGAYPHSVAFPTPRVQAYHCGQAFDGQTEGWDRGYGPHEIVNPAVPPAVCTPPFPGAVQR